MTENIEKTNTKLESHEAVMASNKQELASKRTQKLQTLKDQSAELAKLENKILETGLKSSTLRKQNEKFIQAIKDYEVEYGKLDNEKAEVLKTKEQIENEYDAIHSKY